MVRTIPKPFIHIMKLSAYKAFSALNVACNQAACLSIKRKAGSAESASLTRLEKQTRSWSAIL